MEYTDMKAFMFPADIWGVMMNFEDEEIGHIMKAVYKWIYKEEYPEGLTKSEATLATILVNRITISVNKYLDMVNGKTYIRKRKEIESNEQ